MRIDPRTQIQQENALHGEGRGGEQHRLQADPVTKLVSRGKRQQSRDHSLRWNTLWSQLVVQLGVLLVIWGDSRKSVRAADFPVSGPLTVEDIFTMEISVFVTTLVMW